MIRLALVDAALAAATATGATTSCEPKTNSTTTTNIDSHSDVVEYSAACDMNNHAINVDPNTRKARAAVEAACQNTGTAIDNAPWPSGWKPIPLPK
jgi:hypothetical protein